MLPPPAAGARWCRFNIQKERASGSLLLSIILETMAIIDEFISVRNDLYAAKRSLSLFFHQLIIAFRPYTSVSSPLYVELIQSHLYLSTVLSTISTCPQNTLCIMFLILCPHIHRKSYPQLSNLKVYSGRILLYGKRGRRLH
jgi:hypothetical protein